MAWTILFLAGLFEVAWAVGIKHSEGFTRLWPTVFTISTLILSFVLLNLAMKNLPVGTAYPVWVGIGSIGTVICGILLFKEPVTFGRILSICLVIAGIIGLKLCTAAE
jgi:quaternary ammonium compound-resistance protein SugE